MNEHPENVEGKTAGEKRRLWVVRHWLLSLFGLIVITGMVISTVMLLQIQEQQRIAADLAVDSQIYFMDYGPKKPAWVTELIEWYDGPPSPSKGYGRFGDRFDWPKIPRHCGILARHVDTATFDALAELELFELEICRSTFSPEDLQSFIERSPTLINVALLHCDEFPAKIAAEIRKARPEMTFRESGEGGFFFTHLTNVCGGARFDRLWLNRSFQRGEVLTAIEGQPLQTYHQVKRKVGAMKPGESVRFKVRDVAGVEREEVFTVPVK